MNNAHDTAATDREALARHGDTLTHAVTVHQPLAWALAAGHCPVIMSDTRPGLEHEGKLIGIHASKQYGAVGNEWPSHVPSFGALTYGALIGVARLVGVIRGRHDSAVRDDHSQFQRELGRGDAWANLPADVCARIRPWFSWRSARGTPWGLLLEDAVLLPEPIPMRGAGGVWRLRCDACGRSPADHDSVVCSGSPPWARALEQWRKARAP